jgi:hypothetical protein
MYRLSMVDMDSMLEVVYVRPENQGPKGHLGGRARRLPMPQS